MRKIIVIGDNAATGRLLEDLRAFDQESEIRLFAPDGCLPFDYRLFGDYLAKSIKEEELFYGNEKFYKERKIEIFTDKKITKIDLKKNRIVTESKEEFFFDLLIFAVAPAQRLPDIKGANKTGVFDLKSLSGIKGIASILPIIETVSIESNSIESLKIACGLRKRNKEVIFVVRDAQLLADTIDAQSAEVIAKYLEESGIRFFMNNAISEVLGDGDAKAIRLKSGKVLASQIILFEQTPADLRLLAESGLETGERIFANEFFKTNKENIFAFGQACQFERELNSGLPGDWLNQASLLALNLKGEPVTHAPSFREISFKLFDMSVSAIGETGEKDDISVLVAADPPSKSYKKFFARQDRLIGAVLINAENEKERITRFVRENADVHSVESQPLGSKENLPVA